VTDHELEGLLRPLAPQVLGAVVRRYGDFDLAEDATQEALVAAAATWPASGYPDHPKAWLITVASRRLTDLLRAEQARRRREDAVAASVVPSSGAGPTIEGDDTLPLLFMCCHPSLAPASQIALTLRAVGGLTTDEIARAFMVSVDTMTRRITRAKQTIKDSGVPFRMPPQPELDERLGAVLHVLYLIFNEGYASTQGADLYPTDLSMEAIRLTRIVHRLLPDDGEVRGLLALMLLTDARRPARSGPAGELIPVADQDRRLWNQEHIGEGLALLRGPVPRGVIGPYRIQAAIAAVHDEAPSSEVTDWPRIVALYELLMRTNESPMVALNHAVAVAMARGPAAGLELLCRLGDDRTLGADHRFHAVRAHLLEMSGDVHAARDAYEAAAERATNLAQQRYLRSRAAGTVEQLGSAGIRRPASPPATEATA
jgi:RNA polymerase sigma factor (sigma-70 family)